MRLLVSLEDENVAKRLATYLQKAKIENTLDSSFDEEKKKTQFNIWIHNEDAIFNATQYLNEYLSDPMNQKFDVKSEEIKPPEPSESSEPSEQPQPEPKQELISRKPMLFKITFFFLFLCVALYFINYLQEVKLTRKHDLKQIVLLTPLQKMFFYDLPEIRVKLDEVIIKYHLDTFKKLDNPPLEAQEEIDKIESMPAFKGLYDIVLLKLQNPKSTTAIGPLFEKIRQGEVWRLFTPAILHAGLLHILFNMMWLWYLGKQIEPKLGFLRYLLFIIIVAIASNTAQYFMGGPYFLGFSGVITGMIGYIFVRQKVAPWEGYIIPKPVFYFIGIFVLAMLFIQIVSFSIQIFKPKLMFTPGIANTAHIIGAVMGILLAKVPFFSWRKV